MKLFCYSCDHEVRKEDLCEDCGQFFCEECRSLDSEEAGVYGHEPEDHGSCGYREESLS